MLTLFLLACVDPPDREGIAIGNPPNMTARVAPPTGATLSVATIHVGALTAGCGSSVSTQQDLGAVDLLGANSLPLPSNDVCVLSVGASAPMEVAYSLPSGRQVAGRLDIGTLSVLSTEPLALEGGVILELGAPGWLDGTTLPESVTSIEPGTDVHALLVAALRSGTGLFVDSNADGLLSTEERAAGALLAASTAETAVDPGGTPGSTGDTAEDQEDTAGEDDQGQSHGPHGEAADTGEDGG